MNETGNIEKAEEARRLAQALRELLGVPQEVMSTHLEVSLPANREYLEFLSCVKSDVEPILNTIVEESRQAGKRLSAIEAAHQLLNPPANRGADFDLGIVELSKEEWIKTSIESIGFSNPTVKLLVKSQLLTLAHIAYLTPSYFLDFVHGIGPLKVEEIQGVLLGRYRMLLTSEADLSSLRTLAQLDESEIDRLSSCRIESDDVAIPDRVKTAVLGAGYETMHSFLQEGYGDLKEYDYIHVGGGDHTSWRCTACIDRYLAYWFGVRVEG
jgi:hypothetical protein